MANKGQFITRRRNSRLDKNQIKDGLVFLIEKAPKNVKPHLDADALADKYSDQVITEARGESKIMTSSDWKRLFLDVYGLEVYGAHDYKQDKEQILKLVEPCLSVSSAYPNVPTNLIVIQPGIPPIRAIRMATLSDKKFDELLKSMPIAVIKRGGPHLLEGNNRTLQAHYRGRELPTVDISLRNNLFGQNLSLILTRQRTDVDKIYGSTGVGALQTSLYQKMIEDMGG